MKIQIFSDRLKKILSQVDIGIQVAVTMKMKEDGSSSTKFSFRPSNEFGQFFSEFFRTQQPPASCGDKEILVAIEKIVDEFMSIEVDKIKIVQP